MFKEKKNVEKIIKRKDLREDQNPNRNPSSNNK